MLAAPAEASLRYEFKAGPFSSHTLLLAMLPLRGDGLRVLDLGCANGYLAELLVSRGFTVTGVDMPGTPHSRDIHFVSADLDRGLPPLDGLFDFILCADVLEHLRDPLRLLQECGRLLAGGGVLIGSLPNSGHVYFRWNVLIGRFPQHDRGLFDRTHLHYYTWEGWADLLNRAGFHIERFECSSVPVGLALPRWANSGAVRALERLSFELARVWKTLFAYQFVVVSRKEPEP